MAHCHVLRLLQAVVIMISIWLAAAGRLHAAADSLYIGPERVLTIVRLNSDCYVDTIVGRLDRHLQYVPLAIRWGGTDSIHTPACPDAPARRPRRGQTTFTYPDWTDLTVSMAIEKMNPDSLMDMVVHAWGKLNDPEDPRDTLTSIIVFGQQVLDSLATIDLSTVGTFQSSPCFAMKLRWGKEIDEPDVRDPSGASSWVVHRVNMPVPEDTVGGTAAVRDPWIVELYPNPAATSTQMEGRLIPPGDYAVEVISVNGEVERRQDVSVSETGTLFRAIDLRFLPSGYYLVRLHERNGKLFGTYPIIVRK